MQTANAGDLNVLAQSLADAETEGDNAPRFYITIDKATGRNVWNRVTNRTYPSVWRHAEANPYRGTQAAHECDDGGECQYVEQGPYSVPPRAAEGDMPHRLRVIDEIMSESPLGFTDNSGFRGWRVSEAKHAGDVKTSAPGIDRDGYYVPGRMAYRLSGPEGGDRDREAIRAQFPALHAAMYPDAKATGAERMAKARAARADKQAAARAVRESLAGDGPVIVPSRTFVRQGDARLTRVMAD